MSKHKRWYHKLCKHLNNYIACDWAIAKDNDFTCYTMQWEPCKHKILMTLGIGHDKNLLPECPYCQEAALHLAIRNKEIAEQQASAEHLRIYGEELAKLHDANTRIEELKNMLEDVVNELDLSNMAIEYYGPIGTPPAELVKLVLTEKDFKIAALKTGMIELEKKNA